MVCKHRSLYQNLDKFEIPYVFIQGIYSEMRDKPHILMDDAQGGYLVTRYLLELGHKRSRVSLRQTICRDWSATRDM